LRLPSAGGEALQRFFSPVVFFLAGSRPHPESPDHLCKIFLMEVILMFMQSITPAVKSHLDVQLSFANDYSKKLFDAAQNISQLNLNLAQELFQEMATTGRHLIAAKGIAELASVAATPLYPATEKLRNYQQQLTNLVAGSNVELTKTAEAHLPEASRTAKAVADELVRAASEESEKASQRQREVIDRMSESARRGVNALQQNQGLAQSQSSGPDGQHATH
jgi:phasin family protein